MLLPCGDFLRMMAAGCVLLLAVTSVQTAAEEAAAIEIESDSIEYNHVDGSSVYLGNVVIERGDLRLTGSKVEIFTENDKVQRIVAEGSPATCRDHLEEQSLVRIQAERIDYDDFNGIMNLYRNARLDYDGKILHGEHVIYNLDTKQIKVPKGRKRVRFTIPAPDTGSDIQ